MHRHSTGTDLTPMQSRFIDNIIGGMELLEAYAAAGYAYQTKKNGRKRAGELIKRPKIAMHIEEKRKRIAQRNELNEDFVLKRLMAIASADPARIVGVEKVNCRHCWGSDFKYQFTDNEMDERVKQSETLSIPLDEQGGGGYTEKRPPHPDCPNCGGRGKTELQIADTRNLGPNEKVLYAGAEYTRNGIKIKMHDQMNAVIKLGDYLGLFESRTAEELRRLQLAKVQAETDALNRQALPIKVEIQVQDASNPVRVRGKTLAEETRAVPDSQEGVDPDDDDNFEGEE